MAKTVINVDGIGEVHVYRKRGLKNIRLSVNHSGVIRLSMPWYVPKKAGVGFIKTKKEWLLKQKNERSSKWQDGDSFLGYLLTVNTTDKSKSSCKIISENIVINLPSKYSDTERQDKIKSYLDKHLKSKTEDEVIPRAKQLAAENDFKTRSFRVKKLKSRWGSCDNEKNIIFSSYMAVLPLELQDYVIFHELAHTIKMSHGKDFWKIVNDHVGDHKQKRKELSKYSPGVFNM